MINEYEVKVGNIVNLLKNYIFVADCSDDNFDTCLNEFKQMKSVVRLVFKNANPEQMVLFLCSAIECRIPVGVMQYDESCIMKDEFISDIYNDWLCYCIRSTGNHHVDGPVTQIEKAAYACENKFGLLTSREMRAIS